MRSRTALRLGATLLAAAAPAFGAQDADPPEPHLEQGHLALDRAATEAFRAGDHATASALWTDALAMRPPGAERARLLYNLGNAAYRRGALLEAVGWYTAALRLSPRDGDLWANLELARAEAELEPADRGDLAATFARLLSSLRRAEAEWLALLGLLPLAVALAGEAARGGRAWRRLIAAGAVCALLAAAPLGWHVVRAGGHPLLVVEPGGAQGRSEPRPDADRIARLEAGEVVQHRDVLPGWIKAADERGRELWFRESALFDLVR